MNGLKGDTLDANLCMIIFCSSETKVAMSLSSNILRYVFSSNIFYIVAQLLYQTEPLDAATDNKCFWNSNIPFSFYFCLNKVLFLIGPANVLLLFSFNYAAYGVLSFDEIIFSDHVSTSSARMF
jgi:hypothetical protein